MRGIEVSDESLSVETIRESASAGPATISARRRRWS